MKILAFDPGKNDFAFAAINQKAKVCDHGFIRSVTSLSATDIHDEITRFLTDIDRLLDRHQPELVVIERMQHRPHLGGGAVVEYINLMIGMALTRIFSRGHGILMVSASTWKSHMKRTHGVKGKDLFTMVGQKMTIKLKPGPDNPEKHKTKGVWIDGILDRQIKAQGLKLVTHEGDAVGLACYGWWTITKIDIVDRVL
jgi:Holliday junction resolvasome RuvABC endonuclease subunit